MKAVRAQHDYVTDKITIGAEGEQEVILNVLETNVPKPSPAAREPEPTDTHPSDTNSAHQLDTVETVAEDQLAEEWE